MGTRRRILALSDPKTVEQLVDSLANNGYQVDLTVHGNDRITLGRSVDYAVMIIDRMRQRTKESSIA